MFCILEGGDPIQEHGGQVGGTHNPGHGAAEHHSRRLCRPGRDPERLAVPERRVLRPQGRRRRRHKGPRERDAAAGNEQGPGARADQNGPARRPQGQNRHRTPETTGGSVRVEEEIDTFRIIVGGTIDARRIKASDGLRLGRRGEIHGFVEAPEILIRERARTESLYGDEIRIEERARVKNLYGKRIYLEREAVVEGEVLYTEELEFEDNVVFRQEPRKVDSLPPPDDLS